MNLRLSALLLLIILTFSKFSFAIENPEDEIKGGYGIITGRILDEERLPLPGATLMIKSINQGTVSDGNGFYRIVKLLPGKYEITVSYIGFKNITEFVTVEEGKATAKNFYMEAGIDLNEVVVNGALQGQSKALNQQKNSVKINNVISSDQVGRFPDANIGDALKRIPGISVQYDQGEARFGNIRGTSPEYNSLTIDGDRMPSAEAEIRSNQLDLIPADMIQTIEVNKVVTADMDADAIGGSVNLTTKSAPYKRRISGTVGTTYNMLTDKAAENISLLYADRFLNNKLGLTLSGSRQNHKLGSDNVEAEWDESDNGMILKELQVRTYLVQRLRQSYSAAFDYSFNANHKIEGKALYNHRNDWENRFRVVYKDLDEDEAKIEREVKAGTHKNARLEDQRLMHFSLKGEHQLGNLGVKWKGSYAKANEDRPNERYLNYKFKDVSVSQVLTNTRKPNVVVNTAEAQDFNSNWDFDELTEEHQYTEDIDKNAALDFKLPLLTGENASTLRFGGKYRGKSKNRDNDFFTYDIEDEDAFMTEALGHTSVQTKSDFLAGDYVAGTFVTRNFVADLDLNSPDYSGERDLEELAGNFDAKENVVAGYLRYDQAVGKLDIVAGLRFENTHLEYSGYTLELNDEGDVDALLPTDKEKSSYTNVLPSLLLKYNFSSNTQVKAAWTNTISRPKYFALVPYMNINGEDNEISIGNPELDPTTSMNLDLMIEHYYESVGLVSAGVFYKRIQDFIVDEVRDDYDYMNNTWDEFSQPINAGDANLFGVELSFQRQFDFLPGFLRQFGFFANYTYTKSDISNFQIEDRDGEDLSLPGTPENSLNASLYYEGKKFSARLSLNHATSFIDEFGGEAFEDRYYDKVTYLDFNTAYAFTKNFRIYAEANNLLNTPLRYYQGSKDYTMQAEYYDARINLGLKFDF